MKPTVNEAIIALQGLELSYEKKIRKLILDHKTNEALRVQQKRDGVRHSIKVLVKLKSGQIEVVPNM